MLKDENSWFVKTLELYTFPFIFLGGKCVYVYIYIWIYIWIHKYYMTRLIQCYSDHKLFRGSYIGASATFICRLSNDQTCRSHSIWPWSSGGGLVKLLDWAIKKNECWAIILQVIFFKVFSILKHRTCNLSMCLDLESNPQPFSIQDDPPTELHWPGQAFFLTSSVYALTHTSLFLLPKNVRCQGK